ncbi:MULTISPECIES: UTP--glucose-1-phosphate uridylyltransferase [unclassified Yoonia]|uniref:UTP--glucose-1-phosphate uridylyltransferase n=1 Tax=unclassified Yoonia TaxID=2629118 RepID=UPI002AFDEF05|nr:MULTISPECIES: UTP--glucose-1-phosphate uridylyltransferase [unclassified Yoonia]
MTHIRKAVFPVAGLGTRFLPATKTVPKEMLPLIDRPLIQYAVDEARAAGIEEFIFVTSPGKGALEGYFDQNAGLEAKLQEGGKSGLLAILRASNMPDGQHCFIRQAQPLGLGHAVRLAARLVGDEPFAVLLPDDVIRADVPCLKQMVAAHAEIGGNMVATIEVPREATSSYGVLDIEHRFGRTVRARGMVEKPAPADAPSTQAVVGRYILQPSVMTRLESVLPGAGGEIQLTDAIAADLETTPLNGYHFDGQRFDCGSIAGYVEATVTYAMDRPDLYADVLAALAGPRRAAGWS